MCNDRESFHTFKKLPKPMPIRLGNNFTVYATYHGLANITQSFQAHALFTPTFKHSLFSVSQLDISGYTSTFGGGRCIVKTGSAQTVLTATLGNNSIYILDDDNMAAGSAMEAQEAATDDDDSDAHFPGLPKAPTQKPTSSAAQPTKKKKLSISESRMWHRRLAHLHPAAMRSLIDGLTHSDTTCNVCIKAKAKRKIIRIPVKPTTMPFELVHSDLCGPFSTPSHSGSRYYIIYIDDYTRYAEVYLLADKKAESCVAAFQAYQAQAKARGYDIQRFRCDNGRGEYDNAFFRSILRISGISFEPSPPYSQHKNGVSERMIGVVTEKARAMMIDSQAPLEFWGEAVMSAAYLHRRTPSRALGGKTPWEMLHSHLKKKNGDAEPVGPPPIHHLRRFGCLAHKRIPEEQRTDKKLGDRSKHAMMVGYVHNSTSMWRIWDPDFKKTIQTSDVDFDEEINCYTTCPPPAVSESDGKAIDPFGLPEKEPIHVEYVESADPDALSGTLFSTFFHTSDTCLLAVQITRSCGSSHLLARSSVQTTTCSLAVQTTCYRAVHTFRSVLSQFKRSRYFTIAYCYPIQTTRALGVC
jgi:transposase InsO family protein